MVDELCHLKADITLAFRERRFALSARIVGPETHIASRGDLVYGADGAFLLVFIGNALTDGEQRRNIGRVQDTRRPTQRILLDNDHGLPWPVRRLDAPRPFCFSFHLLAVFYGGIEMAADLKREIEILNDKIEGLEADLYEAVSVALDRGAVDWAILNYPDHPRVKEINEDTIRAVWASTGREPPDK